MHDSAKLTYLPAFTIFPLLMLIFNSWISFWARRCSRDSDLQPTMDLHRQTNNSADLHTHTHTRAHTHACMHNKASILKHSLLKRCAWPPPFLLCTRSTFLDICLPLRLAGVVGLPLLAIVALKPQPMWGRLQKGYVNKKLGRDVLLWQPHNTITSACYWRHSHPICVPL